MSPAVVAGRIVNNDSQCGLYPAPEHIAYNVSTAAVVAFTQNPAGGYASHTKENIPAYAVAPGWVATEGPPHDAATHRRLV
ncbi:hypothetical protein GCM10009712_14200 [Pseudarthrobacter sulfonivorans]|uniref:SDR family NAD(P)-dependent oxidoreductase n=1 Tax=Pseudarthrobacter sulfonivorans TaxID=121292 RepID=UPI00295E4DEC|nr:SDR family NAD(P)-dependent oxidoreductase [Pseudarthrobacter sulfonivorans]